MLRLQMSFNDGVVLLTADYEYMKVPVAFGQSKYSQKPPEYEFKNAFL